MNVRVPAVLLFILAIVAAGSAAAQIHCSELPPLTPDTTFPRWSSRELAVAGFPDHMHAYGWSGWQVMTDSEGITFGPGSMCHQREVVAREGLVVDPGHDVVLEIVVKGDRNRLARSGVHGQLHVNPTTSINAGEGINVSVLRDDIPRTCGATGRQE